MCLKKCKIMHNSTEYQHHLSLMKKSLTFNSRQRLEYDYI